MKNYVNNLGLRSLAVFLLMIFLTNSSLPGFSHVLMSQHEILRKGFQLYVEGNAPLKVKYYASISNTSFSKTIELVDHDGDNVYTGEILPISSGRYTWFIYYTMGNVSEVISRGEEWIVSGTVNSAFWSWNSRIEGVIWLDSDKDGEWDPEERTLTNVEVILYKLINGNLTYYLSSVTNEEGYYRFSGLSPGTYYIDIRGKYVPAVEFKYLNMTRNEYSRLDIGVIESRAEEERIVKTFELRIVNPAGSPKGVKYYIEVRNSTHYFVKELKSYTIDVYRVSLTLSPGFYIWEMYYMLGVNRYTIATGNEYIDRSSVNQVRFSWPVDKTFKLDIFYSEYVPSNVRFFAEISYDGNSWVRTELKPWGVGGTGSKFPGAWLGKIEKLNPGHIFYRVYYVYYGIKRIIEEGEEELLGINRINLIKYTWPVRFDVIFVPIGYPYVQISPDGNSANVMLNYKLLLTPLTKNLSKYGFVGDGMLIWQDAVCVHASHVTPRSQVMLYTEVFEEETIFRGYIKARWDWPLSVNRINMWYGLLDRDLNVLYKEYVTVTSDKWVPISLQVRKGSRIAIGYDGGARDTILLLYLCLKGGIGVRGANRADVIGVKNIGDAPVLVKIRFKEGAGLQALNITLSGMYQVSIANYRVVKYSGKWVKLNPGEVAVIGAEIAGSTKYSYTLYVYAADEWEKVFERLELKLYGG